MKNNHNKLALILSLFLTSCSDIPDYSSPEHAKHYAKAVNDKVYNDYLNCYALTPAAKTECMQKLTEQYIKGNNKENKEYTTTFQYECEKIGFKKFLNAQGIKCEDINEGPKFLSSRNAYEVICTPETIYFMRFNYNKKEWQMVE